MTTVVSGELLDFSKTILFLKSSSSCWLIFMECFSFCWVSLHHSYVKQRMGEWDQRITTMKLNWLCNLRFENWLTERFLFFFKFYFINSSTEYIFISFTFLALWIPKGELNRIATPLNIIGCDVMQLDIVPENSKIQCIAEGIWKFWTLQVENSQFEIWHVHIFNFTL